MKPLSPRKRRIYVWLFVLLFFISVPLALFYASGYRFGLDGVLKTGGIFLSVPYDGATIFLNGEEIGKSGLLNKSVYVGNLVPASYEIEVTREGDHPWTRLLIVESELVTDATVFLVPHSVSIAELTTAPNAPTTTKHLSLGEFSAYLAEFDTLPATTTASSIGTLVIENGALFLRWKQKESVLPSIYCEAPSSCLPEIAISAKEQRVTNAAFFGGGIVYSTSSGIYVREADTRPTTLVIPLYAKAGSSFRVIDGRLIVKDGKKLYEILDL